MTRTRRKLKAVNIGPKYHHLLELLVEKNGESADGNLRGQAEKAIFNYARQLGVAVADDIFPPEPPYDAT
jgi:hypothetical protein